MLRSGTATRKMCHQLWIKLNQTGTDRQIAPAGSPPCFLAVSRLCSTAAQSLGGAFDACWYYPAAQPAGEGLKTGCLKRHSDPSQSPRCYPPPAPRLEFCRPVAVHLARSAPSSDQVHLKPSSEPQILRL